jgi:beta-xylosidase
VLRLYGNCYDLTSPEAPALLLRKQTSYNQVFQVKMNFSPTVRGYEAGVVLWWSQHSYASLGVVASENEGGKVENRVIYKGAAGNADGFKVSKKPSC